MKLRRRGVETKLIIDAPGERSKAAEPDPALVKMIGKRSPWWEDLVAHRYSTIRALAWRMTRTRERRSRCCSSLSWRGLSQEKIARRSSSP